MDNPQNAPRHTVSSDPFIPGEIAERLEAANVQRASLPTSNLVLLGLLGGVYIGFGGALATLVATDTTLGYGLGRLASGLAFSLGLIMLVLAGGELFTGNNLMVLAFAGRKVSSRALLRNWGIAYLANAVGAILLAFAIHLSGSPTMLPLRPQPSGSRRQRSNSAWRPPSYVAFSATCWCAWRSG